MCYLMKVLYSGLNKSKDISEMLPVTLSQLRALQRERNEDKISLTKFRDELQALEVTQSVLNV